MYTLNKKPKIAERDIVCWDICLSKSKIHKKTVFKGLLFPVPIGWCISEGFRVFISKRDLKYQIRSDKHNLIRKAIIPKGAKYYIGSSIIGRHIDERFTEYVASEIIFV